MRFAHLSGLLTQVSFHGCRNACILFDMSTVVVELPARVPDLGRAPAFRLFDSAGVEWAVPVDGRATLLAFIRGHWCPYCRRYLAKLQANVERLSDAGRVQLLAISPEPVETSAALARDLNLTIPILADTDGTVIARYGVRNRFMGFGTMMPHPSVFLIDAEGRLRFRSVDRNYKRRTTIRTLSSAIDRLRTPNAE